MSSVGRDFRHFLEWSGGPMDAQLGCGLSCVVQSLLSESSHLIGQQSAVQLRQPPYTRLQGLTHRVSQQREGCYFLQILFDDNTYIFGLVE